MIVGGRTVLVTGAGSGIGAATARLMARAGARVLLLARSADALERVAAGIRATGRDARVYPADLADAAAVERMAAAVTADCGTPDVVVNNAGAGRWLFLDETSPEELQAMMGAPTFAALHVTRAFLPGMLARGSGHVVNVNSPASRMAWPGATGYVTARWALRGFTAALRADLRGTGIRVTHVVPGKVSSSYFEHNPGSEERVPWVARFIRTLTPEEAAEAILHGVERDRREVVVPFMLRLFYLTERFAPRLVEATVAGRIRRKP